ncbi:hypothetical protein, partial [Mycobacterium avium]|uniref:hypothetical protein n=1 Tax=Mycobacterium avium TaxID=1764 RepID=UPI00355C6122|nr:hypothetical protein [Mycobacterium avium subsp. hominissuis]
MADSYGITPAFAALLLTALGGARPRIPIVCAQLHNANPGPDGTNNTAAVTARQEVSFTAPAGGAIALTSVSPSWEAVTAETVAAVSLWSGFEGDPAALCLLTLAAAAPVTVAEGDTVVLGSCDVVWAPAAQGLWLPGKTIAAGVAQAAAVMLTPALKAPAVLAVPVMAAAAQMSTPAVHTYRNPAPVMAAAAAMWAPTVTGAAKLTVPVATAAAAALAPAMRIAIAVPSMTAAARALAPSATASTRLGVPVMAATAQTLMPRLAGSAVIPVMTAQARATELPPTVSASARIAAPAAAAAAQMRVPSAAGPTFTPFTETNVEHTNQAVPAGCNGCWVTANGGGAAGQNGVGNHLASGMGGGGSGARIDRVWIPRSLLGTTYSTGYGRGGATAAAAGGDTFFRSGNVNLTAGGGQPG